jgi:hypothetical protein
MPINYVKGQILAANLERDGINLSISNANVGINKVSPTTALDVAGVVTVGNITISNVGNINMGNQYINNLSTPVLPSDAVPKSYVDSATGNSLANLRVANTTITTDGTIGNITIQPTSTGVAIINTTTGLVIPVGTTAQRPSPARQGTMRFNSDNLRVEVYDGTEWDQIVSGVTNQSFNGDGSTTTFTLDRQTTTAAALIMLNGVTQVPGTAYNMSPNPSTTLIFTEAPASTDVIDIRFL